LFDEATTVVVAALCTACVTVADVAAWSSPPPEYAAATECVPTPEYVTGQVALPPAPTSTVPQPAIPAPPSVKAIVPPAGVGETLAV